VVFPVGDLHAVGVADAQPPFGHRVGLPAVAGAFLLLIWAEKRFRLGGGLLFALAIALYTLGRLWIEALRVDHANHILGLRLNVWTAIIVFAVAVAFLVLRRGRAEPADTEPIDTVGDDAVPDGTRAEQPGSGGQPVA
jgi:hypothetical protein